MDHECLLLSEIGGQLGGPRDATQNPLAPDDNLEPDARGARWLRRHMPGGVAAITTVVDGGYRASTVTACILASAEPTMLLVSIENDSQMDAWLSESKKFCVNILPWREQFLADQFAGFTPRASTSFHGIAYNLGPTGCPILSASAAWADCVLQSRIETGDHACFIGTALALGAGSGVEEDPLVYYLNRYRRLR